MSLIHPSAETDHVAAERSRKLYRSDAELALRVATERWGRARWPDARVCHELVVGRGTHRADLVFVSPQHLVAVEIKGPYDGVDRLIGQAASFRLACPELWVVTDERHKADAELVAWLLPSLGIAVPDRGAFARDPDRGVPRDAELVELRPAQPFEPHPEALISLLWVRELYQEALRLRLCGAAGSKLPSHKWLVDLFLARATAEERLAATCRQLRGRDAFWRADPPIRDEAGHAATAPPFPEREDA